MTIVQSKPQSSSRKLNWKIYFQRIPISVFLVLNDRTVVAITCSACQQRLEDEPPICCKCIDENASCNNDIAQ